MVLQGGKEEWQTIRVDPDDVSSITIFKLIPDTMYQFMILSRNRLGDGLFSPKVAASTKGSVI